MENLLELKTSGIRIGVDDEGFLLDPSLWTAGIAREFAAIENINLEKKHWSVLYFIRDFYDQQQIPPGAGAVLQMLAEEYVLQHCSVGDLASLFPGGYKEQACKIAGMRKPVSLSSES